MEKTKMQLKCHCHGEAAQCFVSVSSSNSTIRRAQVLLQIYRCVQINSLLIVVVVHVAGCNKYSFTDASPSVW